MSEAITLARPYARAAFDVARTHGVLDAWSTALTVSAAVAVDPRTHGLLNDPRVGQERLVSMHLPPNESADGAFARFLGELAHFRRLELLPEIAALFDALKRESEATLKVRVTSAMALDAGETEKLRASLHKRFQRDIEMEVSVDPALLGGVVIDTGSEVIDGSARGRLNRLASTLAH